MKKNFLRLALVALPALCVVSCGGDDLFGTLDSGTGTCPANTTVYQVKDATYPPVAGSAAFISDGCNTGIAAAALETKRTVQNDKQGNITLYAADGSTIIGSGPVRCNGSTLSYSAGTISDGVCRFTANYMVDLTITADNAFTMKVTQARSMSATEPGQPMTCGQPPSCSVSYTVSQKL